MLPPVPIVRVELPMPVVEKPPPTFIAADTVIDRDLKVSPPVPPSSVRIDLFMVIAPSVVDVVPKVKAWDPPQSRELLTVIVFAASIVMSVVANWLLKSTTLIVVQLVSPEFFKLVVA